MKEEERADNLPTLSDFSQHSINKTVASRIRQNPVTLGLGVGTVAVTALSMAWWGLEIPLIVMGIAGVMGTGTVGNFLLDMNVRKVKYIRDLVAERRLWLNKDSDRLAVHLQGEFQRRGLKRALSQLGELEGSFNDLQELLNGRFSNRGLSKDRFLGHSLELRERTLEKLSFVLDILDAVESIPVSDLEKSLGDKTLTNIQRESIQERLGHYKSAQDKVVTLQDGVEQSLTRLSEITIAVTHVGMKDDSSFESQLREMERLSSNMSNFVPEV